MKLIDIDDKILYGRILSERIILHGIKISAFCTYAPTDEYADSSKDRFFNTLNQAIQKAKRDHPSFKVLVGANMNAAIGTNLFDSWPFLS